MKKVICPFCGKLTDEAVCPRCFAEVPRETVTDEEAVKEEQPVNRKNRKTDKEV